MFISFCKYDVKWLSLMFNDHLIFSHGFVSVMMFIIYHIDNFFSQASSAVLQVYLKCPLV